MVRVPPALRIHSFYCEPGLRGAHEKGGVEGQVGYLRRNYLTPVPKIASLDDLNTRVREFEAIEESRRIGLRIHTIGQAFLHEAGLLMGLPDDAFETGLVLTPGVDRYALITVADVSVLGPGPDSSAARSGSCCAPPTWSPTTDASRSHDTPD
ncbi:hypothetical protein [Embleya sp. NBC_00896]|uniref:hypothetical protein n=1 Tax=Embleya sp. NBC_00896 TaxID=2975961 RepID=UPI003869090F|nr:hypothetical protein OG928_00535 [Embleya sp. NBC_00896]